MAIEQARRRQLLDEYREEEEPGGTISGIIDPTVPTMPKGNMLRLPAMLEASSPSKGGKIKRWRKCFPGMDTGADYSCVSLDRARSVGAIIRPLTTKDPDLKGVDDSGLDVVGTARLRVRCLRDGRDVTFHHRFMVLKKMESDLLFGLDIFPQVGAYVGGVATRFPGDTGDREAAEQAAAVENELRTRRAPWELEDRHGPDEVQDLMQAIEHLLAANTAIDPSQPACASLPELATLRIRTPDRPLEGSKTFRRQFSLPLKAEIPAREQIKKWTAQHCFEPADPSASADYNTPLLAIGKKDRDGLKTAWRICMDLRHINQLISQTPVSNARVPRVEELLQKASGFTHATCLDLTSAYQQLPVAPQDRHKLAFTFGGRRLQWKRWPFGLAPCTAQFQKLMETILDGIDEVAIYVDDCIVLTKGSMADHTAIVAEVLRRLNYHGLRLNVDKCHFGYKRVTMLGHQLSGEERNIDPVKVRQAIDWPEPSSAKQVQRFLGFTNFLRGYIPNFAQLAAPLDSLRSRKGRITLDREQRRAFHDLVQAVTAHPVLSNPDPDLPLQVATDASQTGMGAVLYQEGQDGKRRYIAFASKSLDGAQRNYPATKRELLAVIFALRAFSLWLRGSRFTLYTDHQSLTTMFTNPRHTSSYIIANWMDVLLEYDFEIRHRPGIQMLLPDTLSRLYSKERDDELEELEDQLNTNAAIRMVGSLENSQAPEQAIAEFISERLGKRTISSREDQIARLRAAHEESAHFGAEQLFRKIWRSGFWWKGLRKQCDEIVQSCNSCLSFNIRKQGFHPTQSLSASDPWDHVAMDLAVDLPRSRNGNVHILIMVDVASRFVVAKPLPDKTEHTVARAVLEIFTTFGPPKAMQSDRGKEFVNSVIRNLAKAAGTDQRWVAPYNPQANGLAERSVKLVKDGLRKKLEGRYDRWDEALPAVTWAINTREHSLTKTAPFTLFFGRAASAWSDYSAMELSMIRAPAEARAMAEPNQTQVDAIVRKSNDFATRVRPNVNHAMEQRRTRANEALDTKRKTADPRIKPGCLVYIINQNRASKLEAANIGPFLVDRKAKRGTSLYLRNLANKKSTIINRPFPVHHLAFAADTNSAMPITRNDGSSLAALQDKDSIQKITADRIALDGSTEYKVIWRERGKASSWVKESELSTDFLANHTRRSRPSKGDSAPRVPATTLKRKLRSAAIPNLSSSSSSTPSPDSLVIQTRSSKRKKRS